MKILLSFHLLFFSTIAFSQSASLIGPVAGLNTNNYGIGIMYRKHLSDYFYLEGAISLPFLTGYEYSSSFGSPTYFWSTTTLGLNAGFNLYD